MTTDTTTTMPRPQNAPAGRDTGMRMPLRILVVGLSLLLIAYGAITLASLLARGSGQDDGSYEGVRTVVIDTAFESIDIVGSADTTTVSMDRTYHWSFSKPDVGARQDGDVLRLSSSCRFQVGIGCTGHLRLAVPSGIEVRVDSSDGSLTLRDLDGPVDVTTADGGMHASNLTGPLTMRTSDGSIDATRLRSTKVDVVTSDGSPRLSFAVAPMAVTATTRDGSIDVVVPSDGTAYAVTATTSDGGKDVALPTDPGAQNRMDLKTSDGSIHVSDGRQ